MPKQIELPVESFIGGWYIPDVSVCDKVINFFEDNKQLQVRGHLYHDGEHKVIEEWKNSTDIGMNLSWPITSEYIRQLDYVLKEYRALYQFADETARWEVSALNIQKYPPGGGYCEWHSERTSGYYPMAARHLVFMTYLNDIEEDGFTEFYYQKVAVRPRKGLTLIWPTDWTHTHRGIRAPKETKYIVTGWLSYTETGHAFDSEELKSRGLST